MKNFFYPIAKVFFAGVICCFIGNSFSGCAHQRQEVVLTHVPPRVPPIVLHEEAPVNKAPEPENEDYIVPVLHDAPRLSSDFGAARSRGRRHKGVDLEVPMGTPVVASRCGKALFAGWDGAYGNIIVVCHGDGTESAYAHLKDMHIGVAEPVKQGQVIGLVGRTGNATAPHLHFEIREEGKNVDPKAFLALDSRQRLSAQSE